MADLVAHHAAGGALAKLHGGHLVNQSVYKLLGPRRLLEDLAKELGDLLVLALLLLLARLDNSRMFLEARNELGQQDIRCADLGHP